MVASHTWATRTSRHSRQKDINSEMSRVEDALDRIIGVRPPSRDLPTATTTTLYARLPIVVDKTFVTWDFDSGDSTGSTPAQSKKAYDKLAKNASSSLF